MKRSAPLFCGALLVALPLAGLMTGCGGGNGGGLVGGATATPTSLPLATDLGSAPVDFGTGQTGTLNLVRTGSSIAGTLVVNPIIAQSPARSTKAFSFQIPVESYPVSGTVNAATSPVSFSLTGNFSAPLGAFSISGMVPTTSSTGSFTIVAGGETVSGIYPKIGGTTTTGTPVPTAITPPGGANFFGTIVGDSAANFGTQAFAPQVFSGFKGTQGSTTVLEVRVGEAFDVNNYRRELTVTLSSANGGFSKGQVLPVTASTSLTLPSAHVNPVRGLTQLGQETGTWGNSTVKSGTVTIVDLSTTSVTLALNNVQVVGDLGLAKGTLTVNGTLETEYATQ